MHRRQRRTKRFLPARGEPKGHRGALPGHEPPYARSHPPNPKLDSDAAVSPGGLKIQGEEDSYDFGTGAGFYVDATKAPWSDAYKMYSYITSELPAAVFDTFKQVDADRVSIFGHSMGGHGALTLVR